MYILFGPISSATYTSIQQTTFSFGGSTTVHFPPLQPTSSRHEFNPVLTIKNLIRRIQKIINIQRSSGLPYFYQFLRFFPWFLDGVPHISWRFSHALPQIPIHPDRSHHRAGAGTKEPAFTSKSRTARAKSRTFSARREKPRESAVEPTGKLRRSLENLKTDKMSITFDNDKFRMFRIRTWLDCELHNLQYMICKSRPHFENTYKDQLV